MELKSIEGVVQKFSKLTGGSNLPTLTVEAFAPRTDDIEILKKEIKESPFSEEVQLEDSSYIVGPTTAASPHTPIKMENEEGNPIPAHFIMWCIKQDGKEPNSAHLVNLSEVERIKVLNAIADSTYQSVNAIKQMSNSPVHPAIYGVKGYAPISFQVETGLSKGAPTNPYEHFHIANLTKEELHPLMKQKSVKPGEMLKHISPFNTIFDEAIKDAIVRKLNSQFGEILNAETVVDHSKHPESEGISFFEGYKLKFKEGGVDFGIAMNVLTKFAAEAQGVYTKMLGFYENFYQNVADPEKKEEIIKQCRNELVAFGCSEVEATLLQKQIFSLSPTLSQLNLWLKGKEGLPDDDPNKKILKQRLFQYEKHKKHLQDPQKREILMKKLVNNHQLQPNEAEIILTLIEDKLKNPSKEDFDKDKKEVPKFTMPGQLSLGYSFDYEIQGDKLVIKSITLATRFSEKNIYEDMVGYMLIR